MDKKERFTKAFNYLVSEGVIKKQEDLALAMKASRSNVSTALGGNEKVLTEKFLIRFCRTYPGMFSLTWLLTGEGEMLLNDKNEQQMDALGFAADQVGKMTSALIVALDRVRKREAELDEQIKRVSRLEELISRNLEALSKHFNYENSLFNGVGGLTLPDMASEDIPKPNKNNEDYDKI